MILAPFGIVLGRFWCRLKNINLFQPYIFDYSAVDGPNEIVDRRSLDSPCPKKNMSVDYRLLAVPKKKINYGLLAQKNFRDYRLRNANRRPFGLVQMV